MDGEPHTESADDPTPSSSSSSDDGLEDKQVSENENIGDDQEELRNTAPAEVLETEVHEDALQEIEAQQRRVL